jgi:hypothetical protein
LDFFDLNISHGKLLLALAVLQEKDRGLEARVVILLQASVLRSSAVRVLEEMRP